MLRELYRKIYKLFFYPSGTKPVTLLHFLSLWLAAQGLQQNCNGSQDDYHGSTTLIVCIFHTVIHAASLKTPSEHLMMN